jgi:hypothetical protein
MTVAKSAQQMSFGEFAQAAQATQLLMHGRRWEVSLNGSSLGFADGSLQTALVQVHERAVNNALYANSPVAPEWIKADMPSAEVLAEYPHVADRYADVLPIGWRDKEVDPRDVPLNHQQFNAYIEKSFSQMDGHLRTLVVLPAGHAWIRLKNEMRWNINDPLRSTLYGLSFFIGLAPADEHDEQQFAIEVRYFWQRRALQRNGRTDSFGDDQHRVTLWVEQGRPFAGMTKSLLDQSASYFYADDIKTLASEVATVINAATASSSSNVSDALSSFSNRTISLALPKEQGFFMALNFCTASLKSWRTFGRSILHLLSWLYYSLMSTN